MNVNQPPMPVGAQKSLYEASKIVGQALKVDYDDRGCVTQERAALCALVNKGWVLVPPEGEVVRG